MIYGHQNKLEESISSLRLQILFLRTQLTHIAESDLLNPEINTTTLRMMAKDALERATYLAKND